MKTRGIHLQYTFGPPDQRGADIGNPLFDLLSAVHECGSIQHAARSLGASPWHVVLDVILPGLKPAFISAGAICFATAVGAFGTAFTLAARIDVLPMVIYTEFTLSANIAMAAALSFVLGAVTWVVLAAARTAAGSSVAAAG